MNECFFPGRKQVEEQYKATFNSFIFNMLRTLRKIGACIKKNAPEVRYFPGRQMVCMDWEISAIRGSASNQTGVKLFYLRFIPFYFFEKGGTGFSLIEG